MSKRIIVTNRWDNWHVHLEGTLGIWDSGRTITEAVGSFCMAHPEHIPSPFKVVIVQPSYAASRNAPTFKDRELGKGLGGHCEVAASSPDGLLPDGANCLGISTVGKL